MMGKTKRGRDGGKVDSREVQVVDVDSRQVEVVEVDSRERPRSRGTVAKSVCSMANLSDSRLTMGGPYCKARV